MKLGAINNISPTDERQNVDSAESSRPGKPGEFQNKLEREIERIAQLFSLQLLDKTAEGLNNVLANQPLKSNKHEHRDSERTEPEIRTMREKQLKSDESRGNIESHTSVASHSTAKIKSGSIPPRAVAQPLSVPFAGALPVQPSVATTSPATATSGSLAILIEELVSKLEMVRRGERTTLRMEFLPSDLGEIVLTVAEVAGKVALHFKGNADAVRFLEVHQQSLETALLAKGIPVQSMDLEWGFGGFQREKTLYNPESQSDTEAFIVQTVAPILPVHAFPVAFTVSASA